jgi:hypothetical protein
MACGRGWTSALSALALYCVYCVCSGSAAAAGDDQRTLILFSGRDLWRNGAFAYGGLLAAPNGFEEDGLLLKAVLSGGAYRYLAGDLGGAQVVGAEWAAQVMPGWRIKRRGIELKFFMGPDWQRHWLWPNDPGNRLRGAQFGLRVAAEVWVEPTSASMITGDVSLSSIATTWSGRIAGGWRVLDGLFEDGFYIGPEVQYFGADGYRHLRLGVHLTELKAENYEWSAAAGWARDSDGLVSPYVRLNVMTRR